MATPNRPVPYNVDILAPSQPQNVRIYPIERCVEVEYGHPLPTIQHWSDDTRSRFYGATASQLWYINTREKTLMLRELVVKDSSATKDVEFGFIGGLEAKDETDTDRIWVTDTRACTVSGISKGALRLSIGRPNESGRVDGDFRNAKFISPSSIVFSASLNALFIIDAQFIRAISCYSYTVSTLSGKIDGAKVLSNCFLPNFANASLYAPPILHSQPEDSTIFLTIDRETFSLRTHFDSSSRSQVGSLSRLNIGATSSVCDSTGEKLMVKRNHSFLLAPLSIGSEKVLVKSEHIPSAPHILHYSSHLRLSLHSRHHDPSNPKIILRYLHHLSKTQNRTSFLTLAPLLASTNVSCSSIISLPSSDKTWRVHLDVIRCHPSVFSPEITLSKLSAVIQNSRLPESSIETFFNFLYFLPLPSSDPIPNCITLTHVIHLCREIGLKTDWPEFIFGSTLLPLLTVAAISNLLISLWQDNFISWTTDDAVIEFLVDAVRKQGKDAFLDQAPLMLTRCTPERLTALTNAVSSSNPVRSPTATFDDRSRLPTLTTIPILEVFDYKTRPKPIQEDYVLTNDVTPGVDPQTFLDESTEFAITSEASNIWYISRVWLLYTQWPLFRALFDSQADLRLRRSWKVPGWINHNILICILESIHGELSSYGSLTLIECRLILEHLVSQGLIEDHNGNGIGCWKRLTFVCQAIVQGRDPTGLPVGPPSASTTSSVSATASQTARPLAPLPPPSASPTASSSSSHALLSFPAPPVSQQSPTASPTNSNAHSSSSQTSSSSASAKYKVTTEITQPMSPFSLPDAYTLGPHPPVTTHAAHLTSQRGGPSTSPPPHLVATSIPPSTLDPDDFVILPSTKSYQSQSASVPISQRTSPSRSQAPAQLATVPPKQPTPAVVVPPKQPVSAPPKQSAPPPARAAKKVADLPPGTPKAPTPTTAKYAQPKPTPAPQSPPSQAAPKRTAATGPSNMTLTTPSAPKYSPPPSNTASLNSSNHALHHTPTKLTASAPALNSRSSPHISSHSSISIPSTPSYSASTPLSSSSSSISSQDSLLSLTIGTQTKKRNTLLPRSLQYFSYQLSGGLLDRSNDVAISTLFKQDWKICSPSLDGSMFLATTNDLYKFDMSSSSPSLVPARINSLFELSCFRNIAGVEARDDTGSNRVWVTDSTQNLLFELEFPHQKHRYGSLEAGATDGPLKQATFNSPGSIIREPNSDCLIIAEPTKLRLVNCSQGVVSTLAVSDDIARLLQLNTKLTPNLSCDFARPISNIFLTLGSSSFVLNLQNGKSTLLPVAASSSILGVYDESQLMFQRGDVLLTADVRDSEMRSQHVFVAPPSHTYDPKSNVLCYFSPYATNKTILLKNVVISSGKTPVRPNCTPDLSSLLKSSVWPHDMILTHRASNRTWNIHYEVISRHHSKFSLKETLQNLAQTVHTSLFDIAIIDALVAYLYLKPFAKAQSANEAIASALVVELCGIIGFVVDFPAQQFQTRVLKYLNDDMLYTSFYSLWTDSSTNVTASSPSIHRFLDEIVSRRSTYKIIPMLEGSPQSASFQRIIRLLKTPSLFPIKLRDLQPCLGSWPLSEIYETIEAGSSSAVIHIPIKFDPSPALEPGEFAVAAEGSKRWIVVQLWLLYGLWPFFRAAYDSNPQIGQKRCWRAPSWMDHNLLQAIVASTHNDLPYYFLIRPFNFAHTTALKEVLEGMSPRICSSIVEAVCGGGKSISMISAHETAPAIQNPYHSDYHPYQVHRAALRTLTEEDEHRSEAACTIQ